MKLLIVNIKILLNRYIFINMNGTVVNICILSRDKNNKLTSNCICMCVPVIETYWKIKTVSMYIHFGISKL